MASTPKVKRSTSDETPGFSSTVGNRKSERYRGVKRSLQYCDGNSTSYRRAVKKPRVTPQPEENVCANCNKEIRDDTDHYDGDDAIECENCKEWYHRRCANLSVEEFEEHSNDENLPFICAECGDKELVVSIPISIHICAKNQPYNRKQGQDQIESVMQKSDSSSNSESITITASQRNAKEIAKQRITSIDDDSEDEEDSQSSNEYQIIQKSDSSSNSESITITASQRNAKEIAKQRIVSIDDDSEDEEDSQSSNESNMSGSLEDFIVPDDTADNGDQSYDPEAQEDESGNETESDDSAEDESENETENVEGDDSSDDKELQATLGQSGGECVTNVADSSLASQYWGLSDCEMDGSGEVIAILDTGISSNVSGLELLSSKNFFEPSEDNTDTDPDMHGTQVAIVAACKGKIFYNIPFGMAPGAKLASYRVAAQSDAPYSADAVCNALHDIHSHNNSPYMEKIRIVVMSFRLPDIDKVMEKTIKDWITKLHLQGVVCVAAAGNDGENMDPRFPATSGNTLTVGSVNKFGRISEFSTDHKCVDVLAPGENIIVGCNSQPVLASGTSFAAPAVAGLIARLFHCARKYGKCETVQQISDINYLGKFFKKYMMKESCKLLQPERVSSFFSNDAKNIATIFNNIN